MHRFLPLNGTKDQSSLPDIGHFLCLLSNIFTQPDLRYLFTALYLYPLIISQQPCRFSQVWLSAFLLPLGCSDCLYDEISIIPTKHISEPVSKFLLEKRYKVSNLVFLGCSAGYLTALIAHYIGRGALLCMNSYIVNFSKGSTLFLL